MCYFLQALLCLHRVSITGAHRWIIPLVFSVRDELFVEMRDSGIQNV